MRIFVFFIAPIEDPLRENSAPAGVGEWPQLHIRVRNGTPKVREINENPIFFKLQTDYDAFLLIFKATHFC